jgi:serine-type D-Ala-D-Ala carboxypeptidase (penicillin-binding protein 5/6)
MKRWLYLLIVCLLLGGYGYWALTKPLPFLQPDLATRQISRPAPGSNLAWPPKGQAAVGILDTEVLESHGNQKAVPVASVAKVITALVVLQAKPLGAGHPGPLITMTDKDVALYRHYANRGGSLLPVKAGEKLSEYQMLQAMMLPSANNIADSLAIWAYGSLKNYQAAANVYLKSHGLVSTRAGSDASGMSPSTVSNTADLVKLGNLAMRHVVLADIVGQRSAKGIPLTSSIHNVNRLLGTDNIVGIKTGNTDEAGGVFLSASRIKVNQKPTTIITAIAGTPDLPSALSYSLNLIKSAHTNLGKTTVVKAGETVASYRVPWGVTIDAIAAESLTTTNWNGSPTEATVYAYPTRYNAQTFGTVNLSNALNQEQAIPVKLKTRPSSPSVLWRLTHPL